MCSGAPAGALGRGGLGRRAASPPPRDDGLVYGSLPAVNPASEHYDLAWAAGATLKDGFNWDDYLAAREHFSKISTKQQGAASFAAKNDYAPLGPGAAGKNGVTANTGNITAAENALLDGGSTPPNKYNYNITDMDKRCIYLSLIHI